jgi:tetratricopeptide (TPR) repeat protein
VSQSADDDSDPSKSYIEGWAAIYELIREGKSWSGRERHNCFLNTGTGRFADISAVAGLDLKDDGRGLAVVDWDLDGALDFWTSNRTGPQVRFLRNLNKTSNHFVAVRLEGRTSNRDAIGARLELQRPAGPPLVRVLQAGDAYLAQSSKWVHFGLGDSTAIERIVVRWPGGEPETFRGLEADRRYRLVQGSGQAAEWRAPREPILLPEPGEMPPPPGGGVRTYLAARLPLAELDYLDESGAASPLRGDGEHPLLITLWASWCEHCRHELTEIAEGRGRLERQGLRVLALSVDEEQDRPHAREFLESLDWSFESGYADERLLDVLNIIRQAVVDLPGSMVLPMNFLVDPTHRLAALYRGPAKLDTLLSDTASLDLDPELLRDRATPFAGRWISPPPGPRGTENLANLLRSRGHTEIATAYLVGLELPGSAPEWARERRTEAFETLGRSLAAEDKHVEAVAAYAEGLAIDPMRSSLHQLMGVSLVRLRRLDGAIKSFETSIRLDPRNGDPHFDLGSIFVQRGRLDDGAEEFLRAIELSRPGTETHYASYFNLGVVHDARRETERALHYANLALEEKPDYFDALRFKGWCFYQQKKLEGAIELFERALELEPNEPRTLYQLALTYQESGDRDAALRRYEMLERVDPQTAAQLRQALQSGGD